jgi:glutamyl-tRNA synthetase
MPSPLTVRFAPSPTGYLHVGGARTAIFNWLYARSSEGRFLLRIEDTDRARSSDEMTREILDGLTWLGLDWDNEPVMQSTRVDRHREECLRLLAEGKAYWCYCTPEELEANRQASTEEGAEYRYDRHCLRLTEQQRREREASEAAKVLRFKVPEGETNFYDIVHEGTTFQNCEIDDFILLRSDGTPVYMVAVVVDDHDMGITHVIRGDDHLSNTPKQILLYEAFGYEVPMFGHVPLILGEDKKRLSKRHGATSVGEYRDRGYLPEAVFNFLTLLGWSPGDDREVMSRFEMIQAFDVRRLLKKSSVFDEEKLRWMNGKHIRLLPGEELMERLRPHIPEKLRAVDDRYMLQVLELMKERMFMLDDVFENGMYFFEDPVSYDVDGMTKHWKQGAQGHVRAVLDALDTTEFKAAPLEQLVRRIAEERGAGAGKVIHPLRLALTGGTSSPGLFEMMEVLGKDVCIRRIERMLEKAGPAGPQ